jgi:hypothetical protein
MDQTSSSALTFFVNGKKVKEEEKCSENGSVTLSVDD